MALSDTLDRKVQGALVRSQFQDIKEMDAPSSYFFGLEKKNGQEKAIHTLLSDTGQEIREPSQIRGRNATFFKSLYSSEYREDPALLEEFCSELPQILPSANAQLEATPSAAGATDGTTCRFDKLLESMDSQLNSPGCSGPSLGKACWMSSTSVWLLVPCQCPAGGQFSPRCLRRVTCRTSETGGLVDNIQLIRDVLDGSSSLGFYTRLI